MAERSLNGRYSVSGGIPEARMTRRAAERGRPTAPEATRRSLRPRKAVSYAEEPDSDEMLFCDICEVSLMPGSRDV